MHMYILVFMLFMLLIYILITDFYYRMRLSSHAMTTHVVGRCHPTYLYANAKPKGMILMIL